MLSRAACLTVITVIVFGTYHFQSSDRSHAQSSFFQSEQSTDIKAETTVENIDRPFDQHGTLQRRLPNCLIIGQMKCGTTALLRYLALHPDIAIAHFELSFFNTNYRRGLEWYRNKMPFSLPDQLTVEKTPEYCMSNTSASRILAMNARIKLILLVRDPIVRSISHWMHQCRKPHASHTKEADRVCKTFESSGVLTEGGHVDVSIPFIRRSAYANIIQFWTPLFALGSQLLIVDGDKLVSDPITELEKIQRFLGVRNYLTNKRIVFDEKRGFYCMVSDSGHKKCMDKSKGNSHPTISPEVKDKLRNYFRPLNERFYKVVGIDFGWS